jgi:hypothetical protein
MEGGNVSEEEMLLSRSEDAEWRGNTLQASIHSGAHTHAKD